MRTARVGGKMVVVAAAVIAAVGVLPARSHALPHGCVSFSNSYWITADMARRSAGLSVHRNEPCAFQYSPGDTYSGTGAFIVRCSTGGEVNHPDFQEGQYPPVAQQPIPQPCRPGATVTIHANQPFQGGAVVAGSPS